MAFALGNLDARMDVHQPLIQPLAVAPDQRIAGTDPAIGLALGQSNIDLRTGKTDDKFGLFQTEHISEHPPGDVNRVAHRLSGDAHVARRAQFFQVGQPRVAMGDEEIVLRAVGRAQIN